MSRIMIHKSVSAFISVFEQRVELEAMFPARVHNVPKAVVRLSFPASTQQSS